MGGGEKVEADAKAMVEAAEKRDLVTVRRQLEAGVEVDDRALDGPRSLWRPRRPPSDRQAAAR